MGDSVEISFRYIERDYVRALRADYARRLNLPLDFVVVVVLAGIGVYLWRSPDFHWLAVGSVVISVGFLLLLLAAFTVIPRIIFRREPKFRDEYTLTFSSDGIHFRTAHIDSRLQWSMYSHALVDAHSYLLYHGARQFSVVPKRVFTSADQQRTFEELLTQHASPIVWRS